jgi:hypothetical protein
MVRRHLALALAACVGACHPPSTTVTMRHEAPRATTPCERAEAERDRAAALADEGRLDRALRVSEAAEALCKDPRGPAARAALRRELGLDREPMTEAEAFAEISAGMSRRAAGDRAAAQRRFDRALTALRRRAASEESIALFEPAGATGVAFDGRVAAEGTLLSGSDRRLALVGAAGWDVPTRLFEARVATLTAAGLELSAGGGAWHWLGHTGGEAPNALACRIGAFVLPYAVCEERWRQDGALAELLGGT